MKKKTSKKNQGFQAATKPRIIQGDSIKGSDDVGNYYNTQAELAQHQELNRNGWYATNKDWWRHSGGGGYGGNTDEEAMVGDGGGEADGVEGLAFLDRLILESSSQNSNTNKKLKFARAIDAGAGVGRITKHILLKRYDTVNLVEADAGWSKRSKTYLGRKRAARCTFTCSRIEELVHDSDESSRIDLVWLQWTLQYLTDADAVETLQNLATRLILRTGILIVKENRPYGAARQDRFQMDTPSGSGRYDITRSDDHHRLLFQRAGLTVNQVEEGVETNTYALSRTI
jgi:protein N-terminal methyltransferase